MNKRILVVAAHADDEALGCGGTIAKYVSDGDEVHLVFLADGVTSRDGVDINEVEDRRAAAENSQNILGVKSATYLGLPDNSLDTIPLLKIVKSLEEIIRNFLPSIIYTHHSEDLNIDHRITYQAVITACRPVPGLSVREIYSFEVISSTDWSASTSRKFNPQLYTNITNYIDIKVRSLEAYRYEMREHPHSRSIEHALALAKHRGLSMGCDYAESFEVIRILN